MTPEKYFLDFIEGVGNIDFNMVINGLGILYVFFWFIVIGWVWNDVTERSTNRIFRAVSMLLVIFLNIPGLIIYMILRPRQTIAEIYWSDLERRYLRYETAELGDCDQCGYQLQPGFVSCPNCSAIIKVKCEGCGVYIDKGWRYCPFCSKKNGKVDKSEELSADEMDKRVKETKKDVEEKVRSKGTRYATRSGIAVQVGDAVLNGLRGWGERIDGVFRKPSKKNGKSKSKK